MEDFLSGDTNKIFYNTKLSGGGGVFEYYMPAYLRLTFNAISAIDFKNLKADTQCDFHFTLNVKDLPDPIPEFIKYNIRFIFANDN